jgi:hypothetical protein
MPNIVLKPGDTWTITIQRLNPATMVAEPFPAGTTFTFSPSSPAIGVTAGKDANGNPAAVLTTLTEPSNTTTMGMNFTVNDSNGDVQFKQSVDYPVPVAAPDDLSLDVAGAVVAPGTPPTAPPPAS